MPSNLQPLAFLIGIWRSEHGGKAIFPTIPKFTYGEEIQFSLADTNIEANKALNYTLVFSILFNSKMLYLEPLLGELMNTTNYIVKMVT